jgi:hypothetical protein
MSPEQIAAAGTEHAHQCALFCWISKQIEQYPELQWVFAIPNGGERSASQAARLKAEGVKSGVSDIFLPFPKKGYSGFFIEMKKPKGKESKEQKEFGSFVTVQGFLYSCCIGWEEARDAIKWYLT